jgi:hypothetical protein
LCFKPCRAGFTNDVFTTSDGKKLYYCSPPCGPGMTDAGHSCIRPVATRQYDNNIRCDNKDYQAIRGQCVAKPGKSIPPFILPKCLTPGSIVRGRFDMPGCFKPCPAGMVDRKDEQNTQCVLPCSANTSDPGGFQSNICAKNSYLRETK